MSIFGVNKNLMDRILREAEEEEFDIDDNEFADEEEEESSGESDAKAKAVDDIMNGDGSDDSGETTTESEPSEAKTKAVDDIMNDTDSGSETESQDSGDDTSDTSDGESESDTSSDEGSSEENFDIDDSGDGETSGEESSGDTESGEDEDFSIDGMDDDGGEGGDESGDGSDDTSDTSDSGSGDVTNELIEKEKELFSNLTEEQMKIKTNELKKSFVTLSDTIEGTSERLSSIPGNGPDNKIIKFLISKLDYLSNMVNDYMVETFASKTYIENTIYYQTCLAQLNTIKKVLEEMATKAEKEANQKDKS